MDECQIKLADQLAAQVEAFILAEIKAGQQTER